MSCPTIIQVTNISPQASKQQMTELFSYLGDIGDLKLFPEDDSKTVPSKVCFVNFNDVDSVSTALHLTNTIFIDRALVISRSRYETIPGEEDAMSLAAPAVAIAANQTKNIGHTAPLLPTPPILNNVVGGTGTSVGLAGIAPGIPAPAPAIPSIPDPNMHLTPPSLPNQPLISMMGTVVPTAPPLTGNVDPSKIEEIRRTVYVGNLNSSLTADQVLNFFLPCGEIKYVRMAGDETQPTRFVFVEFARPESVPIALQYNGAMFGDRPVKVNHSKNAIVKPQGPSAQETMREVEEAMRKVKEATLAISQTIDKEEETKKSRSRSRSLSRSRDRRYSRDHYRRRSRSPYRPRRGRRDRTRSPPPRRRSRSPRRRSRSPLRRRSRSPAYRRSRSPPRRRSRSPLRRRSRTPPRRRSRSPIRRRSRSRRRSRTPPPIRRRSRSGGRRRSRSPPRRPRRGGRSRSRSVSISPSDRKRKHRGASKDRKDGRRHSRSPSPTSKRSSRKKDRRRSSKSPYGPSIAPGEDSHHSSSRSKKKKHKHHKRKNHSPSPLGLSPSPSPPPKAASEADDKSSVDSVGSPDSAKSGMSVDSSPPPRPSRRSLKEEVESDKEGAESGQEGVGSDKSSSPAKEEMDSDSSYD